VTLWNLVELPYSTQGIDPSRGGWRAGLHVTFQYKAIFIFKAMSTLYSYFKQTKSKEQNIIWKSNNSLVNQKNIHLLRNPTVHYPVHKNSSLVPTLSQTNPAYILPYYLFQAHFNIILSRLYINENIIKLIHMWSTNINKCGPLWLPKVKR
jgi:hypothetical protein